MREREMQGQTAGETVGVKTSMNGLNMWSAKVLANTADIKGALSNRLYHALGAMSSGKQGSAF